MFHIIIPTFNRQNLLPRAIDSVLNQKTYINYNIYLIDDWSTDNTKNILNNYSHKNIFYFYKNNWWVSSARNFWIKEVLKKSNKGDFILFLDSDDELVDDSLKIIYEKIKKYNKIKYFAFWVKDELWNNKFYNKKNNQEITYIDSLSESKLRWEFFRVISVDIFEKKFFYFPEWLNWGEFFFRNEINKFFSLLSTNEIVRVYHNDNIWITRDLLNKSKVYNFLNVTKLFLDNYWKDLYLINKRLLWLHYLVYSRMLALSWNKIKSIKIWILWFLYSLDFFRFFLYLISLFPYWISINNFLLKLKK